jgi:hypothetical protein
MEEFVVGFGDNTEELTPIDVVMDICGLTYEEVLSCCEVISIQEPEIPDFDL